MEKFTKCKQSLLWWIPPAPNSITAASHRQFSPPIHDWELRNRMSDGLGLTEFKKFLRIRHSTGWKSSTRHIWNLHLLEIDSNVSFFRTELDNNHAEAYKMIRVQDALDVEAVVDDEDSRRDDVNDEDDNEKLWKRDKGRHCFLWFKRLFLRFNAFEKEKLQSRKAIPLPFITVCFSVYCILFSCFLMFKMHDFGTIMLGKEGCGGVGTLRQVILLIKVKFIPSDHPVKFLDPTTLGLLFPQSLSLLFNSVLQPTWINQREGQESSLFYSYCSRKSGPTFYRSTTLVSAWHPSSLTSNYLHQHQLCSSQNQR